MARWYDNQALSASDWTVEVDSVPELDKHSADTVHIHPNPGIGHVIMDSHVDTHFRE